MRPGKRWSVLTVGFFGLCLLGSMGLAGCRGREGEEPTSDFSLSGESGSPDSADPAETLPLIRKLLQEVGRLAKDPEKDGWILEALAVAQVNTGETDAALKTADVVTNVKHDVVLRYVATALARRGEYKRAQEVVDAITDKPDGWAKQSPLAWLEIGKVQADRGDRKEAIDSFAKAVEATVARETGSSAAELLADVAVAQARSGDRDQARLTFKRAIRAAQELKDKDLGEIGLDYVAVAQAKVADLEQSWETVDLMPSRHLTWHRIAAVRAEAKDLKGAIATVARMREPGPSDWLIIARAQFQAGERPAAEETLKKATEAAKGITDPESQLWAAENLATAQAELGDRAAAEETFQRAVELAATSGKVRYKDYRLRLLAAAQAKAGFREAGKATYAKALRLVSSEPGGIFHEAGIKVVAEAQAKSGYFAEALEAIKELKDTTDRQAAIREVAGIQAEQGDVRGAEQTATGLTDSFQLDLHRKDLAEAHLRAGDWQASLDLAKGLKDGYGKASLLRRLGALQAEKGEAKEALAWCSEQKDRQVRAAALLGVAEGMLRRLEGKKPE
jgi:tetratricopeptide (TPR) repeat protein